VTIALGTRFFDASGTNGVVCGTDSQFTDTGGFKYEGKKIFNIWSEHWALSLAFAGSNASFFNPIHAAMWKVMKEIENDPRNFTTIVEKCLSSVLNDHQQQFGEDFRVSGTRILSDHPKPANEGHLKTGQR
jgi:hypothetical protein